MQDFRIQYVADLFRKEGFKVEENHELFLTEARIRKYKLYDYVLEIYQKLGGVDRPPFFTVKTDLLIEDQPFFLDDALNFNRYRLMTLNSPLYDEWDAFPRAVYRRQCKMFEKECMKAGKRQGVWTNPEAVKFFGPSAVAGDFYGQGSSGWKYNAYRCFLQDLAVKIRGQRPVRLSLFDEVRLEGSFKRLQRLFESRKEEYTGFFLEFLKEKLSEQAKV